MRKWKHFPHSSPGQKRILRAGLLRGRMLFHTSFPLTLHLPATTECVQNLHCRCVVASPRLGGHFTLYDLKKFYSKRKKINDNDDDCANGTGNHLLHCRDRKWVGISGRKNGRTMKVREKDYKQELLSKKFLPNILKIVQKLVISKKIF